MSADSPRRAVRGVPATVPPQVVSDRSIIDSVAGFINDVTLTNQPQGDPKDTITWARFEIGADISDPTFGEDWELEGNAAPPLLLILGYGLGVQVWAIPANGEAVEVLSWRHGSVTALRILPTPISADVEMADEPIDQFADKRPLMAICDGSAASCNSQFCSVNFVSLKEGVQVKTIKFKNPVLDILANRTSIVITFPERIAVFDARTLEDRLSVTSCYPSPGINPNPVALGSRWMAYSENKLIHSKRSGGGCDGDGVSSYTATVLNAAKSLSKGLRELGEQVAAGLTGTSSGSSSKAGSFDSTCGDVKQPGVITILDIKYPIKDVSPTTGSPIAVTGADPIVAHFVAHSDAVVAMEFDCSGMLLLTADKRGHDFHVFRIQPHPAGSHLAAVHHLYVLHRGDTSAKVQNISFSLDSRWVAVSTLRGTTHVFPITPYGGPAGFRTHTSLHVVNRLSRFHRSAGLSPDGRSSSPISSHSDILSFNQICMPYNNPTIPPFPRPHVVLPLAQLRQPAVLGSPPGSAQNSYTRTSHGRQRLSSLSDDNGKPLSVCAVFAKARSWLLDPPNLSRDTPAHKIQRKAVDSLFIMAGHGALIQYDLDTKLASNVAKEKICDDTPIELDVEAKAQWNLGRKDTSVEIQPPLSLDNWLMKERNCCGNTDSSSQSDDSDDRNDRWLSQVEIITHAGPHRRLWMGPQCIFKTYNTPSGSPLSHIDSEAVEIGISASTSRPGRSSPMNMPLSSSGRSSVPVLIESGSYSSIEQSPKLMDRFRHEHLDSDFSMAHGESRLKEDLADAMRESPSVQHKDTGLTPRVRRLSFQSTMLSSSRSTSSACNIVEKSTMDKTLSNDKVNTTSTSDMTANKIKDLASMPPPGMTAALQKHPVRSVVLIEKVVNPLGTVTTITRSPSDDEFDPNDPYGNVSGSDYIIHENCDEALFRPVVAIFCEDDRNIYSSKHVADEKYEQPPENISTELIVPVIEKKQHTKSMVNKNTAAESVAISRNNKQQVADKVQMKETAQNSQFEELSLINKKCKVSKAPSKVVVEKEKTPPPPPPVEAAQPESETITSCENENYRAKKTIVPENTKSIEKNKENKRDKSNAEKVQTASIKDSDSVKDHKSRKSEEKEVNPESISSKKIVKIKPEPEISSDLVSSTSSVVTVKLEKPDTIKTKLDKTSSKKTILQKDNDERNLHRVPSDPVVYKTKHRSSFSDVTNSFVDVQPKSKKDSKKDKQKSLDQVKILKKQDDDESGLYFYDKFGQTSDDKKNEKQASIDLDFPSLGTSDVKKIKKKQVNSPIIISPQQSPKMPVKHAHHKMAKEVIEIEDDTSDIVVFTVVSKKKQKKLSSVENKNKSDKLPELTSSIKAADTNETTTTVTKEKSTKASKKSIKPKEFPKLTFESINTDFTESYLPPLSPLEPFESNFESLTFKDAADDHVSLINFESPLKENSDDTKTEDSSNSTKNIEKPSTSSFKNEYTPDNLIFALCGSLNYEQNESGDDKKTSSNKKSSVMCTSTNSTCTTTSEEQANKEYSKESDYKNLSENDEQYLSLEQNFQENTSSSSSEETEETTCNIVKKKHDKSLEDDEELRPLIGGANSACSMSSSTGGKKEDDTASSSSIALEIAKAIIDTLPDSNQSDSSDQANISEPGESEDANEASSTLATVKSASASVTSTSFPSTAVAQSTASSSSLKPTEKQDQYNSAGGSSGGGGGPGAQQNGKKKTKKKKR